MERNELGEVRELLAGLAEAWNAGDGDRYAELFTEDADYVTFFGQNFPGRAAIAELHRALFAGPLKGSTMSAGGPETAIRFVRPDVAIVVVDGGVAPAGAQPAPDRASTVSLVAVRDDDAWRFASFQNTRRSILAPAG